MRPTSLAAHYSFRNSSGSFATLAAIRRASSLVINALVFAG
jgi:hypothetical protein